MVKSSTQLMLMAAETLVLCEESVKKSLSYMESDVPRSGAFNVSLFRSY